MLWLEVGSTNNNPNVVVEFFLSTVQHLGGVPRVVRTDKGTENRWVSVIQWLSRRNNGDKLAGDNSIVDGKSKPRNRSLRVKVKARWRQLVDELV